MDAFDALAAAWDSKYPPISRSWYNNWSNLSAYFKLSQELRKLIYTTNTIEGFNRRLKKGTKAKSVFPTDDSPFKRSHNIPFITLFRVYTEFGFDSLKCSYHLFNYYLPNDMVL